MSNKLSKQRRIENEAVFRQANEEVQKRLETLKKMSEDEGYSYSSNDDAPIYFYCECPDENCRERILIKPSEYKKLHFNRKQFLVKPSHIVPSIENVVLAKPRYAAVKKLTPPSKVPNKLHRTDVKNA